MKTVERNQLSHYPVPCGISILKGTKNAALTRDFIDLALTNPFANYLYDWLKETSMPEEHFIATLGSLTFEQREVDIWRITQRLDSGTAEQRDSHRTNAAW